MIEYNIDFNSHEWKELKSHQKFWTRAYDSYDSIRILGEAKKILNLDTLSEVIHYLMKVYNIKDETKLSLLSTRFYEDLIKRELNEKIDEVFNEN